MAKNAPVSFEKDDYSTTEMLWDQFKIVETLKSAERQAKPRRRSLLRAGSISFDYLEDGLSPLMKAVTTDYVKTAFNLLLFNSDPNLQALETGDTALHLAVRKSNVTMVKALLAFDADPCIRNNSNETPLDIALCLKEEYGGTPDVKLAVPKLGMLLLNFDPNSPDPHEKHSDADVTFFNRGRYKKNNSIIIDLLMEAHKLRGKTEKYFAEHSTLSEEPQKSSAISLLSLDGGGIRILITTQALINIEERIRSLAPTSTRRLCSYFDYIAGTSAGGMTACVLAYLKSDAYNTRAIMSRMSYIISASNSERKDRIDKTLQDVFGISRSMAELEGPQRVIVTASLAHVTPFQLHLMTSYGEGRDGHSGPQDRKVWEACHITAAAPVFSPLLRDLKLLDGGLVANNPTLDAMSEIIEQGKKEGKPVQFGCVVSIGTGMFPREENEHVELYSTSFFSILSAKNLKAFENLATHFMKKATLCDGQEVNRAQAFCDTLGCKYFRLTPPLSDDVSLDTKDEEKLIDMMYETQMYYFDNPQLIDGIAKCLLSK